MRKILKSSNSTYKVFFKESQLIEGNGLNLTFFGFSENPIKLDNFSSFLTEFESLKRKNDLHSIKNIQEIITFGNVEKNKILNFYVLLLNYGKGDNSLEKMGFLIANHQENGDVLLGYWPYKNDPCNIVQNRML